MKSTVFFRSVKTPNEKRMKSGFANNCAIASTSSSRKERRMSRSVCNLHGRPDSPRCSALKVDRLLRRRCQSPQAQDVWCSDRCQRVERHTRSTVVRSRNIRYVREFDLGRDARTERGIRATSAAAGHIKSGDDAGSSSSLHCMSFVQASDPNCFWRRTETRSDDADWRTAGRLRRCRGQTIRWSSWENSWIARSRTLESIGRRFTSRTR